LDPEARWEEFNGGTASDGTNLYIASANSNKTFLQVDLRGRSHLGIWSAVEASTGKILWQVPDPTAGTMDEGALSVANAWLTRDRLTLPDTCTR